MHAIPIFRPGITEFKLNNSALASYVLYDLAGIHRVPPAPGSSGWQGMSRGMTPQSLRMWRLSTEPSRSKTVGRNAGDWAAVHCVGQPDRSGRHSRRWQIPRPGRVATPRRIFAASAEREQRHYFRRAVAVDAGRDGSRARAHTEHHRAECAPHRSELVRYAG